MATDDRGDDTRSDDNDQNPDTSGQDAADEDTDAERILASLVGSDDSDGPGDSDAQGEDESAQDDEQLGGAGQRALERMKEQRNQLRQEREQLRKKVQEYEDQGKSEAQRLQEAADEAKTRASKAEQNYLKMQAAMDAAPEGASLAQVRAVAKRVTGDNADDLAADAEELFALIASASGKSTSDDTETKGVNRKPRERLRGGGEPDEEPEEARPEKLADLIGRH